MASPPQKTTVGSKIVRLHSGTSGNATGSRLNLHATEYKDENLSPEKREGAGKEALITPVRGVNAINTGIGGSGNAN